MLCDKAFAGALVSGDAADAALRGEPMTMHVRECSDKEIRIPFHIGDNRSRTSVLTRTATGLRLKHDHRHEDGSSDAVTMYGGDTVTNNSGTNNSGSATRQQFPVDAESIALFGREGLSASVTNVWAVEVGERTFAYELRRPPGKNERLFRVEFDLSRAVAPPPPPWGS